MKNVRLLVLFSILGLFTLSSCSKKNDDVTPNPSGQQQNQNGFQVKIDGKSYAPDFQYALTSMPGKDGYYGIYGLDSKTDDVVVIALPNTAAEGTYTLNNVNIGMLNYAKESYSTVVEGGTGTVTIKKKTATEVSGTFSFTAFEGTGKKKLTLTEGTFQVAFR
ncbi:Riean_0653 family protein [Spirosoma knui]